MTIDEAIAKEREKAKEQNLKYDKCPTRRLYCCEMCLHNPKCNEVAEQCEQLAEWLELLKWYDQGMEDIPCESGVLPNDVYSAGYIKAIDDFVKAIICELKNRYTDMPIVDIFGSRKKWKEKNSQYLECENLAYKIAEQLKAGGKNEYNI